MIVIDTGPLIAAANRQDEDHMACVELFTAARLAEQELVVPALIVTEAAFMIERVGGPRADAAFVRSLGDGSFRVVDLLPGDFFRVAELVEKYADLQLGTADASVVVIAERLKATEIATLDRRDFSVIQANHCGYFTLLPELR